MISPTEVGLEESMRTVWAMIVERKRRTAIGLGIGKGSSSDGSTEVSSIKPISITGLGLEHFSDIDRFSVIVDFLTKPEHFENVITLLSEYQK